MVGFKGERCIDGVEGNPRVSQFSVVQPFTRWSRKLFLLYAPLKVVMQVDARSFRLFEIRTHNRLI